MFSVNKHKYKQKIQFLQQCTVHEEVVNGGILSEAAASPGQRLSLTRASMITECLASSLKEHTEIFSVPSHLLSITLPIRNLSEVPEPLKRKY